VTCALLLDMYFTGEDLSRLRRCLADVVRLAGLAEPRRSDFVLAVHEVTGNAVQHGGGRGRARLWYADGALRCRVTDDGPGLSDQAIPATLPDPCSDSDSDSDSNSDSGFGFGFDEHGRGLWLARELSDRLYITGGPGGAIVTLEFELAATTHRDTPGLASAAAPGAPARR
jgi:anti-sigma regulatory factor (Ser/Thr protein kinase)